jgi:hypothetical protein
MTALEIMTAALRLIGVPQTGEALTASESADGLQAMQMMLDSWSNQGLAVYAITSESLTLTGAASYTIGSGGTLDTVRPVEIVGATVTSGGLDYPMKIVSRNKYQELAQKSLSGIPQWLWYNPTYALGYLYIFPVGSASDTLNLDSIKPLTEPTVNSSTISFPPGYEEALKYNLAVRMAPEFGRTPDQAVVAIAQNAMAHLKERAAANRVEESKLELLELSRRWSIDGG